MYFFKIIFFSSFFIFINHPVFGQFPVEEFKLFKNGKTDDIKAYNASLLAEYYLIINKDSVLYFENFLNKFCEKGSLAEAGKKSLAVSKKITFYEAKGLLKQAQEAKKCLQKFNQEDAMETIDIAIGYTLGQDETYAASINLYLETYKKIKVKMYNGKATRLTNSNYASILSHLGWVYYMVGELDISLEYNKEIEVFLNEKGSFSDVVLSFSNSSSICFKQKKYREAIEYSLKAIKLIKAKNFLELMVGYDECQLGKCYYELGEYQTALNYVYQAVELSKLSDGIGIDLISLNILHGKILNKLNRFDEAKIYCKNGYEKANKIKEVRLVEESCNCLKTIYGFSNEFELAFKFADLEAQAKDLVFANEKKSLLEIRSRLFSIESGKFSDSIRGKVEIKLEKYKLKEQKSQLRTYKIGVFLLCLLLLSLIYTVFKAIKMYRKSKIDSNNLTFLLDQKVEYLQEIHHRVKNNFQIISSLLNLQANYAPDNQDTRGLREAQTRILSMALVHQKLYEDRVTSSVNMQDYFIELTNYYVDLYLADKSQAIINIKAFDMFLNLDLAVPVGLIANEAITNAMKYGKSLDGSIMFKIEMQMESNEVILRFNDGGSGFSKDKSVTNNDSIGIELIQILTEQLNGTVELRNNNGAEIIIKFAV